MRYYACSERTCRRREKSQLIGATFVVITAAIVAASPAQSESLFGSSFSGVIGGDSEPVDAATLPPFSADLPGLTNSPWTVGKGKFQLETSFAVTHNRSTNDFNFPTLFRYGVFRAVELRLGSNLVAIETGTGRSTTVGTNELMVGVKATILELEYGVLNPTIALPGQVELPTGTLSIRRPKPGVALLAASNLPADLAMTVNIGSDFPEPDAAGDRFEDFRYAVTLDYSLTRWLENLGMYVEHSGNIRTGTGEENAYLFDFGVYYQVTPSMQIDMFAPIGLNSAADDIQGNITFTWRI